MWSRLTAVDAAFGPIVKRAAQLICTTPEFDALAKEVAPLFVGDEVTSLISKPKTKSEPPHIVSYKDIGVTDPAERARLRAELDGLIAHLYGLTETEFAHILTTFPLVAQPVKDAALEMFHRATRGEIK